MVAMSALTERLSQLPKKLGKFKYPVLILLLGLILLLLPGKSQKPAAAAMSDEPEQQESGSLAITEERLSGLLSKVQGAGRVEVMLSLRTGEQTEYQMDTNSREEQEGPQQQENSTVLYNSGNGTQSALVRRVEAPVYQGAIVLCQGADNPSVKLAIVEAVASVTGLGTDQITVVKMK